MVPLQRWGASKSCSSHLLVIPLSSQDFGEGHREAVKVLGTGYCTAWSSSRTDTMLPQQECLMSQLLVAFTVLYFCSLVLSHSQDESFSVTRQQKLPVSSSEEAETTKVVVYGRQEDELINQWGFVVERYRPPLLQAMTAHCDTYCICCRESYINEISSDIV